MSALGSPLSGDPQGTARVNGWALSIQGAHRVRHWQLGVSASLTVTQPQQGSSGVISLAFLPLQNHRGPL